MRVYSRFLRYLSCFLSFYFAFNFSIAEEISWYTSSELLDMRARSHCAAFSEHYQSCLMLTNSECISIYKSAFERCDQSESDGYFDTSNQEATNQFGDCYINVVAEYLVSKGVELNASCE